MTDRLDTELPRILPTAFQTDSIGSGGDEQLQGLLMVLDRQELQPSITRLRDWSMAALAPAAGETAVDVGCGTGVEVHRFAHAVGATGRAIGVEPNPGLRAEAQRRAAIAGSTGVFIEGTAEKLPFNTGSVNVLRCERVFQHLPDPQAAAHEFARVLAPGGRVVVLDSDWGTMIVRPGNPDVVRRYNASFWARCPSPFAGRNLRTWLTTAGLTVDPDIGSSALVLSDESLEAGGMLRLNADQAVAEGALTIEEADTLLTDISGAAAQGRAFASVTMFAAVGRKLQ